MKNNTIAATLVLFSLSAAASAQPQGYDIYVSGNMGLGILQNVEAEYDELPGVSVDFGMDNGFIFAGALGLKNGPYRAEVEYSRQKNELDNITVEGTTVDTTSVGLTGDATANSVLINVYYDIETRRFFVPFISAGLGYSSISFQGDIEDEPELSSDDKDSTMAYHVGGGAGFSLSETIILELRYRYLTGQTLNLDGVEAKYKTHNISAGVRVNF